MSLILSTAPHIRSPRSTQRLMGTVLISLLPCLAAGVYYFGLPALINAVLSMCAAVVAEYVWQLCAKQKKRVSDLSAAVTGLLLALCVTPAVPWWALVLGSAIAVIVVKQLFGGLGDNFLNPALTARAILLASWPAVMITHWLPTGFGTDAVTSATPLATGGYSQMDLFLGNVPGSMGETCKLAILIGFAILVVTRTISPRIPVVCVAAAGLTCLVLGADPITGMLSGGLLFGAVFMATDYVTSPMNPLAQIIYAAAIGVLTILIRQFGAYPEGVTYAILLMNIAAPLLDRAIPKRIYGVAKPERRKAQ